MKHILIIGCGDTGQRVAALWLKHKLPVFGLVKSTESGRLLQAVNIDPIIGDLDKPSTFATLPFQDALIYYFAPPPKHGETDTRMSTFAQHLNHLYKTEHISSDKVIYISTTGVYGDCAGEWINEQTPVNPANPRSRRRLSAEQTLLDLHTSTNIPVAILRVAGIYGPGRLPLTAIKERRPVLHKQISVYSNRIHIDDLANICFVIAAQQADLKIYNVSDGHPGTMTDYYNQVASLLGYDPPPTVSLSDAKNIFSPMMLEFISESKRVDNRLLLDELKIQLAYPDLRSGLKSCMTTT